MDINNKLMLQAGTILHGTYKIEKILGQGSFGITYLAEHTNLGKKVAIKEFFMKELNSRGEDGSITGMSGSSLSQNYCQKFKKEAINLSRLDHPNIVRVTDSFSENGTFYYVMDFIEGQNLNDYIKSHYIDEAEAVSIIKSVADALIYMHEEKHMLHLDLKPGNVMRRNSDGHVFLIDFGLSKHYSTDGQPETSTTIGLGTAGYAPIEQGNQAKNGEFRPTIDVYALGATFYKLLTRETPPPASDLVSDDELLENKLREKGVSDNLIEVVTEAMCPNVRKRTQSVREFRDALTDCSVQTPESIPTKSAEKETIVVKKVAQTTDGEETVVADKGTKNSSLPTNKKAVEETYDEDDDEEDTSRKEIKYFIACLVPLVILYFVFSGFRGCGDNKKQTSEQCADSIENTFEYPQNASGKAVDLGLPSGTLWADRNLDALDETDEGMLFIWGDPTGMNDTVKVPDNVYNISGTEYDIVKEKWGDDWCMPNLEQFNELHDQCSIKKIEKDNIKGYLVTGPNGNTLFFPFSSLYKDEYFFGWEYQMSWTDTREGDKVLSYNIVDGFHKSDPTLRFTIRPVRSKHINR
ncbi:serine/threonine protein kinase [Leyella stercorea]|uniref:serine/threonine protein kinase n=1 Tax=Leyella stercorea TaxID=363265 RepID=UPI002431306D|nr:serine/threonine-protein kinase [Leyella stercorea]